jgi:hypothetical protein
MAPHRRSIRLLFTAVVLHVACASPVADPEEAPAWTLSAEPTLVLGASGDAIQIADPRHEFHQVVAAFELSDGAIAVVNGVPAEVRLFSPNGGFLHLLGREGAGPGEFQSILWAAALGDTLVLWDRNLRRGTLLQANGRVAETVLLRPDDAPEGVWGTGLLPDHRWTVITNPARSPRAQPGLYQDTLRLGILSADGSGPLDPVGAVLTAPLVVADIGEERLAVTGSRFGVGTLSLVLGDRIVLADGESGMIRIFDAEGLPEREFEAPVSRRPLTGAMLEGLLVEALAALPDSARWPMARARHSRPFAPDRLPAFSRVAGDGASLLWLEVFPLRADAPAVYHVVRDDGRLMARVEAPAGFRLLSVGDASVLGVLTDADGVQRVARYRLERR